MLPTTPSPSSCGAFTPCLPSSDVSSNPRGHFHLSRRFYRLHPHPHLFQSPALQRVRHQLHKLTIVVDVPEERERPIEFAETRLAGTGRSFSDNANADSRRSAMDVHVTYPSEQVHHWLVVELVDQSLHSFKSAYELCTSIKDAIEAHAKPYITLDTLHGDMSCGTFSSSMIGMASRLT
ncbi:hypothetical protein OF83DRAFT_935852 [Amylostereum chailletii]|nr:hypothetical protein OF83DRAFT_935852 [Amylostereum chailletii]